MIRTDGREAPGPATQLPADLAPETIKLARYIQALPTGRFYAILLTKLPGELLFSSEDRGRVMSAKR
jgi:hypothetical protein